MCEDARDFDMETPERNKIRGERISKFEDSPIFNFMNNLSPIQHVNSSHGTQMFNSLSLTSISSVFSSPHVIHHKESRFLVRHAYVDSSRHEISSENLDESNLCPRTSDAIRPAVDQENCQMICSLNEAAVDPPEESSTQPSSLPQPIQYDCGSPSHNTIPCYGIKIKLKLDNCRTPVEVAHVDEDDDVDRRKLFATEIELPEEHQAAQSTKEEGCSWDDLICEDAGDMLIYDSPIDSENFKGQDEIHEDNDMDSLICFSSKSGDDMEISEKHQIDIPTGICLQNCTQYPPEWNDKELIEQHGRTDDTQQIFSGTFQTQVLMSNQNQETGNGTGGCISADCKVESPQQRGMRRRCLTFELAGGYTKNSNLRPSTSLPYDIKLTSDDKKSFSLKAQRRSSPCILPSIGLHLNTLAKNPHDRVIAKETVPPGRRIISMPSSISPFPPITTGQYSLNTSSELNKEQCPMANEVQDPEVTHSVNSEAPESEVVESLSQSSPKKKRQRSEAGKESETCKRCNCKKSKCLKLYCECFAAGIYCIEPCSCQGCLNKPIHEETVLATRKQIESRNPLAFAPKVIRASEPVQDKLEETNKTPASARHKRGCNCKKSSCLKKYCECYQGGVGCSPSCRCEGCRNPFGRKDASEELEHDVESMVGCEKQHEKLHEEQQNDLAQKNEDHSAKNILSVTPSFELCRPFDKPPFLSTGKPPRSSRPSIGYMSPHTLRKCEYPLHCSKALKEDDTPEILRGDASPNNGVKTVSPNGKRVSPPCGARMSPNCKGGRKLILKSIPSFPSLNGDVASEDQ